MTISEDYIIGLLWTTATILESYLVVRSIDSHVVEIIAEYTGRNVISVCDRPTVKIPVKHPLVCHLLSLGWSGRKDKNRGLPAGDIDIAEWIKGYCRVRAHLEQKYNKFRVRIYGSFNIISELSPLISDITGVGTKKPQLCKRGEGGDTWALYYQSVHECMELTKWLEI